MNGTLPQHGRTDGAYRCGMGGDSDAAPRAIGAETGRRSRRLPLASSLILAGALALSLAAGARPLAAQASDPADALDTAQSAPMTGFSPEAAAAQHAFEAAAIERIRPATLDSFSYALTREPHVAGTPAQARSRDWVLERMRAAGLRAEAPEYELYLPHAERVGLAITAPEQRRLELGETPIDGDPTSGMPPYPWVNGFSGQGTAEADVVYVNYGLHEDYAALDSLGVDVTGKVAIARYGRSYRGVKAELAEGHGAVALVMYSDPADDGFGRGPVYPYGTWRPPTGAQRGSILGGTGDPTTPGWASVEGARRVEPGSAPGTWVASIPVIPAGYGTVEPILAALGGPVAPEGWQGGLAFDYRVGPGPVRVSATVEDDRATDPYKTAWNTVAWLPGTERPDEWIVVGGHRDAWGPGANDNMSGTSAVTAAALALAGLAADEDRRPRRTIAFATWDAEEWGLIGSTEWVEEHAEELSARTVAYLNLDAIATGPNFGSGASPSLKRFIREITRAVPAPPEVDTTRATEPDAVGVRGVVDVDATDSADTAEAADTADAPDAADADTVGTDRTVYDDWRERAGATATCAAPTSPDSGDVALGNLGGGSDFAGFYNHLGIPSAGFGFGGGWGQYHSHYDGYAWMSRFGDPGYVHHTAAARLAAVGALRLANAIVLPYDYAEFSCELGGALEGLAASARDAGIDESVMDAPRRAFDAMAEAAAVFDSARTAYLARQDAGEDVSETPVEGARPEGVERAGGSADGSAAAAATSGSTAAAATAATASSTAAAAAAADRANAHLMRVERELTRDAGLPGRPWYRNLTFAADRRDGYATLALPGIAEAIRAGDAALVREEAVDLAERVDRATAHLRRATDALTGERAGT